MNIILQGFSLKLIPHEQQQQQQHKKPKRVPSPLFLIPMVSSSKLFHSSLVPLIFSEDQKDPQSFFFSNTAKVVFSNSNIFPWIPALRIQNSYESDDETVTTAVLCDKLMATRYSSRTLRRVTFDYATTIVKNFLTKHCQVLEEITGNSRRHFPFAVSELREHGASLRRLNIDAIFDRDFETEQLIPSLKSDFPHLESFSFRGPEYFSFDLTNWKILKIRNVNDSQLMSFCSITSLYDLDLCYCTKITGEGFRYLAVTLTSLEKLDVTKCSQVTDSELRSISQLTLLRELNVSGCYQITDVGLEYLSSSLSRLKKLTLADCSNTTDSGLEHLSSTSSVMIESLEELDVSDCSTITDTGLHHLSSLTSLVLLKLYHCRRITDCGIEVLRDALPDLEVLE